VNRPWVAPLVTILAWLRARIFSHDTSAETSWRYTVKRQLRPEERIFAWGILLGLTLFSFSGPMALVRAQEEGSPVAPNAGETETDPAQADPNTREAVAEQMANAALESESEAAERDAPATEPGVDSPRLNLLELALKGGALMIPILIMSLVVAGCAFERAFALRRSRVVPRDWIEKINQLAADPRGFDPHLANRVCQEYPSPAASVLRAALLRTGRPQLEIERAVSETSENEAARLYANVRPISLAVTVTPLIGLLGTVWGMIESFFITASNPIGMNKAESLANGIYIALVTTFAGLAVAIPAAILAHYFEGRIQSLFRTIDQVVQMVLPELIRFEGRAGLDPRHALDEPPAMGAPRRTASGAPQAAPPGSVPGAPSGERPRTDGHHHSAATPRVGHTSPGTGPSAETPLEAPPSPTYTGQPPQ
jgi:biopolymer transport protein ExbB